MNTSRPELNPDIPVLEFRSFYWLKEELIAFCRTHDLSTQGSKQALAERIAHFLETGERLASVTVSRSARMPTVFTRDSVIGHNWRCSEPLRAFFCAEIGSHFHFNQVMRDFIKHGEGKTLQEAIEAWQNAPSEPKAIAPQFEYNRHMRAFFEANPSATRDEAIAAWKTLKAQRKS